MKLKPTKEITDTEWEHCLNILNNEFGTKWLQQKGNNPIQILWKREDYPASQELYILSKAIENLKIIDSNCLAQQVNKMKCKDYNTSKGHSFEVIALSYFQNNYKMFPTPAGKAGVDAIIEFDDVEMNWSFKNFGISQVQLDLENKSKNIEEIAKNLFQKRGITNFEITISFTTYPKTKDIWDSLEHDIVKSIYSYNGQRLILENKKICYSYRIQNIDIENLAITNMSYTFCVICPHHENEEKNFRSKLDDAVSNLLKYSSLKDRNKILKNALLVHIPDSIDISNCIHWGKEYLDDTTKNINLIAFYQTYIADTKKSSSINHVWQYATKNFNPPYPFIVKIPVGTITKETYPLTIKGTQLEIKECYIYQNGDIYKNAIKTPKCALTGDLSSIAIGIKTNVVFNIPDEKQSFVISPKIFSPDNKLLIL